ncbi:MULTISPECIES: hypothetical protein [Veillonella]|uniref:Uncharacterized protein n=1 Tax=Veillonella infantium TaxID=1911679 RepID=A0ABX5C1N7_9FIRM|nr:MULTISPECIES: hypothetical protein [Veillonella]PQL20764.1 hypothetical protein VCHSUH04_09730 [Veillonella sp. T14073-2]PQL57290.1 hypothetical protein VCHSUH03_07515 [Veillonella infantium]
MSITKKIEKKLLDKEEKRTKELLDELHMDKKDDSDVKVNVETGNKLYDRLLEKKTERLYVQEEALGIKPNSDKK